MYPSVPCSTIYNSHGSNLNVLNRGMDKDIHNGLLTINWASLVAQMVQCLPAMRETQV